MLRGRHGAREGERVSISAVGEARGFNRHRPFAFGDGEDEKKETQKRRDMEFEGTGVGKKLLWGLFEFLDYSSKNFKEPTLEQMAR